MAAVWRGAGTDLGSSADFEAVAFRSGSGTCAGGSDGVEVESLLAESVVDDGREALLVLPGIGSPACSRERASSARTAAVSEPRVAAPGDEPLAGAGGLAAAAGGPSGFGGAVGAGAAGGATGACGVEATGGGAGTVTGA